MAAAVAAAFEAAEEAEEFFHRVCFADLPGLAVPRRLLFTPQPAEIDFLARQKIRGIDSFERRTIQRRAFQRISALVCGFDRSRLRDCHAIALRALRFRLFLVWLSGSFSCPNLSTLFRGCQGVDQTILLFLFCGENRSSQHVPALPVSSRRESRLLEEDARKRISGMVADGIGSCLAGAHSGGQEPEDVFQAAHGFFDQRNFAMRLASSFVSLRRDFLPPLAPMRARYSLGVFI